MHKAASIHPARRGTMINLSEQGDRLVASISGWRDDTRAEVPSFTLEPTENPLSFAVACPLIRLKASGVGDDDLGRVCVLSEELDDSVPDLSDLLELYLEETRCLYELPQAYVRTIADGIALAICAHMRCSSASNGTLAEVTISFVHPSVLFDGTTRWSPLRDFGGGSRDEREHF